MNKTLIGIVSMVAGCVLFSGCTSMGRFEAANRTEVTLAQNNYQVIKPEATGKSYGWSLLCGRYTHIPIISPTYFTAKRDLYANVGENLTGKPFALANQTEDKSHVCFILFSLDRLTLTADVVEFTK